MQVREGLTTSETISPNESLTPIESFLIGSSINYRGKLINSQEFEKDIEAKGVVDEEMYMPLAVVADRSNLTAAQLVRTQRKTIAGLLTCFEASLQVELMDEGFIPALELPPIDLQTGLAVPEWKVVIQTEKEREDINDTEKLKRFSLVDSMRRHFDLKFSQQGELIMSFHL